MSYFDRKFVCERLRVSLRRSYRIIGASYTSLIDEKELLELINDSRRGIREPFTMIPDDLRTPQEMEKDLGGGVTVKKLLAWTRRGNRVAPHLRINKHTTRFPLSRMLAWVKSSSKSS